MPKRTISKVKHHDGRTSVEWTEPNGKHLASASLVDCPDVPEASFLEALEAVQTEILRRIGITGQTFAKAFVLTGISVSTNLHGHRQFKPSAYLRCGYGGGTGISLPLLREKVEAEGGDNVLSDVALKHVEKLLAEGARYANQERAQGELGLDSEASSAVH